MIKFQAKKTNPDSLKASFTHSLQKGTRQNLFLKRDNYDKIKNLPYHAT